MDGASARVPDTLAHREELWDRCYEDLMARAQARLGQEMVRLHGDYAHVLDESIDTRHDDATGEAWLQGRFSTSVVPQTRALTRSFHNAGDTIRVAIRCVPRVVGNRTGAEYSTISRLFL